MAYLPPLNGGRINASIAGNTTGASSAGALSTGTVVFAGGNNVTLSQATGVNGATISFNAPSGGGGQTLSMYGAGNTTQSSSASIDVRSVSLNGLGGMSVGYSGGSVQLSAPIVSSVSGTGIINISTNGNTVSIGAPAFSAGMSTLGNTSGTSGTVSNQLILAGGNNITLSQSTAAGGNTISISAPNNPALSGSNGSFTYQTASFGNLNGVSFYTSNGSVVASLAALTSQSNPAFSASGGSSTFQTLSFSNGNGITFSNNAGQVAGTVATNYAASTHTHGSPTLFLTNLSGTTASASNGLTLSLSAGAGGAGGGVAITAPNSSYSSGTLNLTGGGALTVTANANTISFNAPAVSSLSGTGGFSISTDNSTIYMGMPLLSQWQHNSAAMYASATGTLVSNSISIARILLPQAVTFSRVDIPAYVTLFSSATANTAAVTLGAIGVLYTRNGATLNPFVGQSSSATYTWANVSNTGNLVGIRALSFSFASSLSAGEYFLGMQLASNTISSGTATTNLGFTLTPFAGSTYSAFGMQDMGQAAVSSINLHQPLQGVAPSIANTSQTIQQSQILQTGLAQRANLVVNFRNV